MHLARWPIPCMIGQVHLLVYIYIYIYIIYIAIYKIKKIKNLNGK